jgi:hypothetical protein
VRQSDQPPDQVGAAAGHPHVGDDEGRAVLAGRRHRVVAGGGLTHDAEIRLLLEQAGQRRSDPVVVVRDDDGDLTSDRGRHRGTLPHDPRICRDACAPLA